MSDEGFEAVSDACARIGWPPVEVVAVTGSTNDDLMGQPGHGRILVATEQTAGHGRLDRAWISRPGEGLTFSVRLDVPATVQHWGWIPLMAGVAVADAVREAGVRDAGVKWPNDVVAGEGKLAGILSVRDAGSAIVGVGLNLHFDGDRPDPAAVSVAEHGGDPQPGPLLAGIVRELDVWWQRWTGAAGDAGRCGLRDAYLRQCVTIDCDVQVSSPQESFTGRAIDVDLDGMLVVQVGTDVVRVAAADVTLAPGA